ncbi:MAG: hypothetical protein JO166_06235 [Deltaproteobacteria bacterium]|nr:hypothetical protein [Deltaproteobacteria bacterium]
MSILPVGLDRRVHLASRQNDAMLSDVVIQALANNLELTQRIALIL